MHLQFGANNQAKKVFDDCLRGFLIKSPEEIINYARDLATKNFKNNQRDCHIFADSILKQAPQNAREVDDIFANLQNVLKPQNMIVDGGWSAFEITQFLNQLIGNNRQFFYKYDGATYHFVEYYEAKTTKEIGLKWISFEFENYPIQFFASGDDGKITNIVFATTSSPDKKNEMRMLFKKLMQRVFEILYGKSLPLSVNSEFINHDIFVAQLYEMSLDFSCKLHRMDPREPGDECIVRLILSKAQNSK